MSIRPLFKQPQSIQFSHSGILAVVLVYALFAALWILLSDKLIQMIISDPQQIILVSMLKGWLFVGITSMLLYGLMHRWVGGVESSKTTPTTSNWVSVPFLSLVAIIVAFTSTSIIHEIINQKEIEVARLQAIADFKTRQIADWLKERQGDAEFVQSSEFFAEKYRRWQESGDFQSGEKLQKRLEQLRNNRGFSSITLLNPQTNRLWGSAKAPLTLGPNLLAAADIAKTDRKTRRLDPYRDTDGKMHLDFIAPLTSLPGLTPLVVLHADMADWLLPTLQTWPVASASGETLLFRRDNNQVLYLNDLRHFNESPANLRLPIATEKLLAAKMLRGEIEPDGSIKGEDYRGIPSIGVIRAIAGTDWFLLAKLDQSELYEEVAGDSAWIGFAGLVSLCMAIAGFYLLRQGQQLAVAEAVQQVQAEHLQALQLLASIAESSDDAIVAKNLDGCYTLFNRAASHFVGKAPEEVLGHDDREIFSTEDAEMLMALDRQVITESRMITQVEVLNIQEGKRIFLSTKGVLRDAEGSVSGVFGISRDITEMKRVEQSLHDSEERLRLALDATNDGLWDWNLQSGLIYFTQHYYKMTGYQPNEVTPNFEFFKRTVHPDDLQNVLETLDAHIQGKTLSCEVDYRLLMASGEIKWVRGRGKVVECDDSGAALRMVGTITDISARKTTEEILNRQAEELTQHNEELERFNHAMIGRELDMIALKQQVNELSQQLGKQPPFSLAFLNTSSTLPNVENDS